MTHYPGLTRGLVAVLLFHDGRRCLATSLRMLVQASAGRRYSTNISRDMQAFITEYTNQQMSDGLLNRILGNSSFSNPPRQSVIMLCSKVERDRM